MEIYDTYIQQTDYDGTDYTQGDVVNLRTAFNIVCTDIPFKVFPEPKDYSTLNWPGEDGLDIYVPKHVKIKEYDMEVEFLYVGTEKTIHTDLVNFYKFLYGRNSGAVGALLVLYNENTRIARKDVVVKEIGDDVFYVTKADVDAIAKFPVTFTVCDPATEVTPVYQDKVVKSFNF